jgi:small subunit ribosomal protein S6
MNNYNLTVLINNKVDDKGRTGIFDDLKKQFGNLVKEELWGVRTMAYEIKHMDKAFYANFEFESEPETVITLDKNIRLNEDIIRYLLVRSKKAKRVKPAVERKMAARAAARAEATEATKAPKVSEVKTEKVEATAEVKSTKRVVKIGAKKKE